MTKEYDFLIIGAGPAGMTAAIYASRAGLNTAMVEAGAPGGKLLKTNEISNWPGIKSETGSQLAMDMFEHSTSFGASYEYGKVTKILEGEKKQVILEDGTVLLAPAVLIATGTKERLLHIPGEEKNIGKGISYCAVCDGAFYRDQEIAVIGAGNSALEEALYLTGFASKVWLLMRRDVFRGDKITVDKVKANPKIEIIQNVIPTEILDNGSHVTGLKIRDIKTGENRILSVWGIFPYIGAEPVTGFLKDLDVLDEKGYLLTDTSMETKIPLLYGAGDVCRKNLRQVVTAVNDGAIAAQAAFHKLQSIE
ncbi:MAG TPA: FAD-dependent oxidoreductase [Candidatus Blautia pullicola]|uniref:FAD-dependent oxidoreductase n=1 Tax=Candidatus Blautia pullicola TaxID=2838498 RepID=A0A9D2FNA7_9FIRM|nr:FAD-dependent oxidoreductase [Candidatus Blautia pullicola]